MLPTPSPIIAEFQAFLERQRGRIRNQGRWREVQQVRDRQRYIADLLRDVRLAGICEDRGTRTARKPSLDELEARQMPSAQPRKRRRS